MADAEASVVSDEEKKAVKGIKRASKRTQSVTSKKAPTPKKLKTVNAKAKLKTTKGKAKVKTTKNKDNSSDQEADDAHKDLSHNGAKAEEVVPGVSYESGSPVKASLEEKRRAIQAERLRKQQEMEALIEQEEALLRAAEQEEADKDVPAQSSSQPEAVNQSADSSYDTRSEIEGSHDGERGKSDVKDEFESMDELPAEDVDDADDKSVGQSVTAESRDDTNPAMEPGLEGLNDGEEEEFAEEFEEGDDKKRPISPVTWDVDVRAIDENISDDSPLASDDDSNSDEEDAKDGEDKGEKAEKLPKSGSNANQPVKIPVSNHVKTDRGSPKESRESSPDSSQDDRPLSGGKTAVEAAELMRPRIHKYLYREAKYYMVKSNNHENVRLAKAKGVWSTPPQNEIRFNKAVEENTTVILVFSVKESGAFQGFARINGISQKDGPKIAWVLPPGISAKALSGVFRLDWISRTDLSFTRTAHLRNPWNQHKPVKIARDGQEIEPHNGEALCKLFSLDGSSDYERVISRVKRKREALQAKGPLPASKPPYRLEYVREC